MVNKSREFSSYDFSKSLKKKTWVETHWSWIEAKTRLDFPSIDKKNFHIFSPFNRQTFLPPPTCSWSFQSLSCPLKCLGVSLSLSVSHSHTDSRLHKHIHFDACLRGNVHLHAHAHSHIDARTLSCRHIPQGGTHVSVFLLVVCSRSHTLGQKNVQDILCFLLV